MSNKRGKNKKNWAAIRRQSRRAEAQRHAVFSSSDTEGRSTMPAIFGGGTIDANGNADVGIRVSSGNAFGLHGIKVIGARQAAVQIERDAKVYATHLEVSSNETGIDNSGTFDGPDTIFK